MMHYRDWTGLKKLVTSFCAWYEDYAQIHDYLEWPESREGRPLHLHLQVITSNLDRITNEAKQFLRVED